MSESIKNLNEVALLCQKIASEKQKVVIYGDSDMDGATSVFIMREIFRHLSAIYRRPEMLTVFFPDRAKDGYGINKKALKYFKSVEPRWMFTVDCGIGNIVEVEKMNKMGFSIVIIDHHRPLESMPNAHLIVDPHQAGETSDFREYANAGLCLKLAELLIKDEDKLKELNIVAALANMADQVPDRDENKKMTDLGIKHYDQAKNIGLLALNEATGLKNSSKQEIGDKIIASLNSADNTDNLNDIYLLLISTSKKEAKALAEKLVKISQDKQEKKRLVVAEVAKRVELQKETPIFIFEGDKKWKLLQLGSAASELVKKYRVPVFLFSIDKSFSTGSARLPSGFNGVQALSTAKEFLHTYGGHPPACGFKFKNGNVLQVQKKLEEYFGNLKQTN